VVIVAGAAGLFVSRQTRIVMRFAIPFVGYSEFD
jgi:hypothetical protein